VILHETEGGDIARNEGGDIERNSQKISHAARPGGPCYTRLLYKDSEHGVTQVAIQGCYLWWKVTNLFKLTCIYILT